MAESEDGQEKSESPSSRKLEKAREEGNIARSKELTAVLLMVGGGLAFLSVIDGTVTEIGAVFQESFSVTRSQLMDKNNLVIIFRESIIDVAKTLIPLFAFLGVSAVIGNISLGGFNFSTKALLPKLSRINPLSGLKRMFSVRSLVELIKALGKFILVGCTAIFVLYIQMPHILSLGAESTTEAMVHAGDTLIWGFIWISLSLILIAALDVPFQIWHHQDQLKMTKQEVKDEFKDTEGKPEIKGRIRQLQREMAQARMMSNVPEADVIITNPTHYSIALKYDPEVRSAPRVVAKGVDHTAFRIREVAKVHHVPLVTAPPLARAIYHTTEIDDEIPTELYMAVAQVLAYVFRLNEYQRGRGPTPGPIPDFSIPNGFNYDK